MGKVSDYMNDKKFKNNRYSGTSVKVVGEEKLSRLFHIRPGMFGGFYVEELKAATILWLDSNGPWRHYTHHSIETFAEFRFARPQTAIQFKLTYA